MQGGEILFAHVVRLASSQAEFSDVQRAVSGLENYSGEQISRAVCRRKNDHLLNLIATAGKTIATSAPGSMASGAEPNMQLQLPLRNGTTMESSIRRSSDAITDKP